MRHILIFYFFVAASTAFADNGSQQMQPLPLRQERAPLCGIAHFKAGEDPSCGVALYVESRGPECGVEQYNQRTDMSCPGSVPQDNYRISTEGPSQCTDAPQPEGCRAGYRDIGGGGDVHHCGGGGPRRVSDGTDYTYMRYRDCQRDAAPTTCRSPSFGVELYSACRDGSHPVESYNSCELPKFGVAEYQACNFYLDSEQLGQFIANRAPLIQMMGENLVTNAGNFYAFASDEVGMWCTIKRYEGEPIFADILRDLKTLYQSKFGEGYGDKTFDCAQTRSSVDIETYSCSDDGNVCRNARAYAASKIWLQTTALDIEHLLSDIVARNDANAAASLRSMSDALAKTQL